MRSVKCKVWSVKYRVWRVEWKVSSVECRMRSVECAVGKVWTVAGGGDLVVLVTLLCWLCCAGDFFVLVISLC